MRRFFVRNAVTLIAIAFAIAGALSAFPLWAQAAAREVPFAEYLAAVEAHSLDLQAQQEAVEGARAGVTIAGLRPDPQFTGGLAAKELNSAAKNNTATALTAGLAFTLETGGKRGARVRNAESAVRLSQAGVESFRDQMQTDAAAAFIEACRAQAVLTRKQSSLAAFRDTVRANEVRLKAGDIGALELRRSRVEAERFAVEASSAAAALEVARLNLSAPLGDRFEALFAHATPACEATAMHELPPIDELIRSALDTRRDVLLARATLDAARENIALVHSNRWVDPVVNVGLTNTPRIPPVFDNAGALANSPAERSLTLGLTVTVPIPLSRLQDGDVRQAESALTQAMLQLRSTELRAQIDVQATHALYRAALQNVQRYEGNVLQDADRVLEGTRLSYHKGAASLLDLLEAQRTADEVHLAHLAAAAELANARVKLQLSSGAAVAL
jgi:cobalt-zinc-cadmium efflux system outer membrane protein